MIALDQRRLLWLDRLVFYPDRSELLELAGGLRDLTLLRVRQADADVADLPRVVSRRGFQTACVDLTPSEDELFEGVHSTSRNLVRQGQRMGDKIEIRWEAGRSAEDFLGLYRQFAAAKPGVPRVDAGRLRRYFPVCEIPVAYLGGEAVCGHLILLDPVLGRARLNLSASRRFVSSADAKTAGVLNRYLHWCELVRYRDRGFRQYDFGGIGAGTNDMAKFKLSFGGAPVVEYDYVLAAGSTRLAFRSYETISRSLRHRRARLRRA